MSLPHVTSAVIRYPSGGRLDELRSAREATLPVRLEG